MKEILATFEHKINSIDLNLPDKQLVLKRSFNEAWFSDTLAWLLDPKASHRLGVKFAKRFLNLIARKRTASKDSAHKSTMLKWGKSKEKGQSSFGFSLKNASSVREFYLANTLGGRNSKGSKYCDVVFFDLDTADSLFLLIENKLFTSNSPGQLEGYYEMLESKFGRLNLREYVYLTLYGTKPN